MRRVHQQSKCYILLVELCVDLGLCLAIRDAARFEALMAQGVDAFTDAVLVAEGMLPDAESKLRKAVRKRVAAFFDRSSLR